MQGEPLSLPVNAMPQLAKSLDALHIEFKVPLPPQRSNSLPAGDLQKVMSIFETPSNNRRGDHKEFLLPTVQGRGDVTYISSATVCSLFCVLKVRLRSLITLDIFDVFSFKIVTLKF